ncbi:deoxyribodipyrimidine photo-lyase [Shewanella corallii]|uniref:Deoxyribodipyrimidine photo-lyase n=1 Tax=Shewanella corallii TaxID=560080 RepID=A0ABT0N5X1_9GAMM|nr:deoxyribodipyrimidine photo-lyase [Shewanella corallii]MCL2913525.1 deoxyribodipyrimidine photo-lyase [Shewanella corallii]
MTSVSANNDLRQNALVWFRQDLRVADHGPLYSACQFVKAQAENAGMPSERPAKVYGVFTSTPSQWVSHDIAPIQLDFIERHLNMLATSLAALGIEFKVLHLDRFEDVPSALRQLCQQLDIACVFAHAEPEVNEHQRDQKVGRMLAEQGIGFELFEGHTLLPPGTVLNQSGKMFRVFTPFSRAWRSQLMNRPAVPLAVPEPVGPRLDVTEPISLDCKKRSSQLWRAGEGEAKRLLEEFVHHNLAEYRAFRDIPSVDGTSCLSPYLAIGVLSPTQCLATAMARFPGALIDDSGEHAGAFTWVTELCWRDFYRHLLVAFPNLSKTRNFNELADGIRWRNNAEEFALWCQGKTGYPIVDAAMIQLNQTGWMHNRLRMIVASFLTKHLLIDWRWGERYFRQQLIDGDLAANNGGWQWSAGTGCDAQPYFRIFNPLSQSEKFDPEGKFIRKFLPQLASVSSRKLHTADIVGADLFASELDYPAPIVDHKAARLRALDALSAMKRAPQKGI